MPEDLIQTLVANMYAEPHEADFSVHELADTAAGDQGLASVASLPVHVQEGEENVSMSDLESRSHGGNKLFKAKNVHIHSKCPYCGATPTALQISFNRPFFQFLTLTLSPNPNPNPNPNPGS